ncbi:MAG: hypothetical protein WCI71_01290 [Bacteroidota bacterium]
MKYIYKFRKTFILLLLVMVGVTVKAGTPFITASSESATSTGPTGATLNANVTPNGTAVTNVYFEYGKTTGYGATVKATPSTFGSGDPATAVSATLVGLAPNTQYYFRAVAVYSGGIAYGTGSNFISSDGVSTNNILNITTTSGDVYYTARGVGAFTDRGIWYGTTDTPPGSEGSTGWHISGGIPSQTITDTGTYYRTAPSLTTGVVYYACGYATIGGSKQYGSVIPFQPGTSAPVTYSCKIQNFQQIDAYTFQFKIYIMRTGGTDLYLNNYQIGLEMNNSDWLQNLYMTGAYIGDGITGLTPGGMTIAYQAAGSSGHLYNHMDVRINGLPPSNTGYLISTSDPGTCIGTFQLHNWTDATHLTPKAFGSIPARIQRDDDFLARTYIYAIVPPSTTGTSLLITNINQHTAAADNLALNATNWNGGSGSDWNTAANWTMNPSATSAVPTSTVNAYIPGTGISTYPIPTSTTTHTCKNLYIDDGGKVTISNSGKLTLTGNLWLGTTASGPLIVQSDLSGTGSLITNGTITGTVAGVVNAKVERYVTGWTDGSHGWHLLSAPVAAQAIASAFTDPSDANYDFYAWWETTNEWVNYKNSTTPPTFATANVLGGASSTTDFIPGKGYLVAYAPAAAGTKQFTGTLNKDNISVTNLAISGGINKGWHLLGNPFPSALKWNDGNWALSNIVGTAQIWDQTIASYTVINANGIIPAGNGFMVQVNAGFSGSNSLTIPAAARIHDATTWYKSTEPKIVLIANDPVGQTGQETVIRQVPEATDGFDPAFDAHFLPGYAPLFYSVSGDEHLASNAMPELGNAVQIPFDFIKNEGESFTIEAKKISNIEGPVMLNDLKTNTSQDLTLNPVYSFTSSTGDNPSRFLITFRPLGMGETQINNPFTIFATGNTISVVDNSGNDQGNVFVYNMIGQLIGQQELSAGSNVTRVGMNNFNGYCLVKVVTAGHTSSTKLFIH